MWDNAPLLRSIANALFGLSLVLVLYGVLSYVLRLPAFPLRVVELAAAPRHVSPELLEQVVRDAAKTAGEDFGSARLKVQPI